MWRIANYASACEKYLKHIVDNTYDNTDEVCNLLHTHRQVLLHDKLSEDYKLPATRRELKWLSDFYYHGRYPEDDFAYPTEQDLEKARTICTEVKNYVEQLDFTKEKPSTAVDEVTLLRLKKMLPSAVLDMYTDEELLANFSSLLKE